MAEFEKADWSIPHCSFERTKEGFKVSFKRRRAVAPSAMAMLILVGLGVGVVACFALYMWTGLIGMASIAFVTTYVVITLARSPGTVIEVTREAVIVDGKLYRRSDFAGLHVGATKTITDPKAGVSLNFETLEFNHGHHTKSLPGDWPQPQGTQFAAAFNLQLKATPFTGQGPGPEELRAAAQPTDF
jgi:hypothetical protein